MPRNNIDEAWSSSLSQVVCDQKLKIKYSHLKLDGKYRYNMAIASSNTMRRSSVVLLNFSIIILQSSHHLSIFPLKLYLIRRESSYQELGVRTNPINQKPLSI